MKKLLVLMLSVVVISQLSVTSIFASSQVPTGANLASQLAAVQSAYNTYITAYNNLYAYAISSGSTYKKNIKAALISANTALASVNSPIAINNYSVSNVTPAILNTALNNCNTSLIPALNNVVSASSNASYQKYAKSGNSNASGAGTELLALGQSLVKQLQSLVASVTPLTPLTPVQAVQAGQQLAVQEAQQAVQVAQSAVQAAAQATLLTPQSVLPTQTIELVGLYKEAQSVLQSAQAALSQASSAQTVQAVQAAEQAAQAAQQQAFALNMQILLYEAVLSSLYNFYPQLRSYDLSPLEADNYSQMATSPIGDFLSLSAANSYNQGQMFVSLLAYLTSSDIKQVYHEVADQQLYQEVVVSLILYTLLDSTSGVTAARLMSAQNVFAGLVNGTNGSPLASSQMSDYLVNVMGLQFTGGVIPTAALNLLINVSKANWSAIYSDSTQVAVLVNAFNAINISSNQFTAVFSGSPLAYAIYCVNAFKELQSSANLYMNCSINPSNGQPSDNFSVYYAVNPSTVTSDLATEFANVQVAKGVPVVQMLPFSFAGINNVPYSYKTGAFYDVLSILSATDASNIWNSVCSKSSSSVWFNTPQIRQIISSVMTQNNATTSNLRMLK